MSILSKISSSVQRIYSRAEDLIEEEREFPVAQNMLNATFQKYVTDNVELLKDLHADLYDDWLRLYATVDVAGIYAALSVDLKLVQMEFNPDRQLIVFEQISQTQVIESRFSNVFKKMGVNFALFLSQKVLKKDPLAPILQHYKILEAKHGLLYLDLNQWLGDVDVIMRTLRKVNVNHGVLKETELVLIGQVDLDGILNRDKKDYVARDIDDDSDLLDDELTSYKEQRQNQPASEQKITPIKDEK